MKKNYTLTLLVAFTLLFSKTFAQTYCVPTYSTGTVDGDYIDGVTLGTINNLATGDTLGLAYNDYTNLSTNLVFSQTYNMTIIGGIYDSDEHFAVFIDYNGDFDFNDPNELVHQTAASTVANQVFNFSFTVPANVLSITTRMRVVNLYSFSSPVTVPSCPDELFNSYGETEDYTVVITGTTAPIPNFTASSYNVVTGSLVSFTDVSANTPTSWSWSFPGGSPATSNLQNPVVTYNTAGYYNVTLTATNASGSNTLTLDSLIYVHEPYTAYCNPTYSTGTSSNDYIDGVILGSINNIATGSNTGEYYNDYTSMSTTLVAGNTYSMQINGSTYSSGENYAVFIDYNGNFDFSDAGDKVYQSPVSNVASQVFNFSFTVPANITNPITTRMRVVNIYSFNAPVSFPSCPDSLINTYGETEDYTVNISPVLTDISNMSNANNSRLTIYPNPANEFINVQSKSTNDKLILIDILGNEIIKQQLNSKLNKIDIHSLSSGVYFIKVGNESLKFIKK